MYRIDILKCSIINEIYEILHFYTCTSGSTLIMPTYVKSLIDRIYECIYAGKWEKREREKKIWMVFYFFYQSHMVLRGTHELFTLYYICCIHIEMCVLLWYIQKLFIFLCFVFIPLLLFSYARKSMQHKSLKNERNRYIKNFRHSTVFSCSFFISFY